MERIARAGDLPGEQRDAKARGRDQHQPCLCTGRQSAPLAHPGGHMTAARDLVVRLPMFHKRNVTAAMVSMWLAARNKLCGPAFQP